MKPYPQYSFGDTPGGLNADVRVWLAQYDLASQADKSFHRVRREDELVLDLDGLTSRMEHLSQKLARDHEVFLDVLRATTKS